MLVEHFESSTMVNALVAPGQRAEPCPVSAHEAPLTTKGWAALLRGIAAEQSIVERRNRQPIYVQGAPADAVYFLLRGKVNLAVISEDGKEAIVATLGPGEFFGEGCLAAQSARTGSATSVGKSTLARVPKPAMTRLLYTEPGVAEVFIPLLLARLVQREADFVNQIFNSCEKRLARMLLLLSHFGEDSTTETVVDVNQAHLAQMIGTTRSRVNVFMNKFRALGYIDYRAGEGLTIHRRLRRVLNGA